MFLPLILIAGGYLYGAARAATFSNIEKRELVGAKTGVIYRAEFFPDLSVVCLQAPDGTVIAFEGTPLALRGAHGDPVVVKGAQLDFEGSPMFQSRNAGMFTENGI